MSADRDQEIEDLFDSVIDRPPLEREAVLDVLNATSPEVVACVRALLVALDGDVKITPQRRRPAVAPIPQSGDRVGPYLLVEEIGEGGFGVVYRASRQIGDQSTDVAIKFLKITSHDPELQKRFELERQVLAELSHPRIARLIDGGTTAQGVPYLVMDFVQGEPITAHCNRHHLNISKRLELFVQVCGAVEYAHRRQFLHRDLKPENIFVTSGGSVMLLDFGIIKMLAPDTRRALPVSMPGRHLFSLTHASPEQVRGSRLSVASDVYSLGVVLYELLCGQLPFAGRSLWELAEPRAGQEREPSAPSKAIFGVELETATDCATRPRHLEHLLRGDLDAIALTAIRRSIEDRYTSVETLRLDVQRFLAGLPVEARPPTRLERASKWVRRNPVTCSALILAGVLYIFGTHQTRVEAGRERDAESARVAAMIANQHLLAVLPEVIRSMNGMPESSRLQTVALGEQVHLLQASIGLPRSLDEELAQLDAYPVTAFASWRMGRQEEAQQLLSTAIERLGSVLKQHPKDSVASRIQIDALCMRARFRELAGQLTLAAEDRNQLRTLFAATEDGSRSGPCQPISNP